MTSDNSTFNQENARHTFQQDNSPSSEQPTLPLLELHRAIEQVGAYEKIRQEKHRQVLQAYLTTEAPMGDLQVLAEVKTIRGVNNIIHSTMQKVFPHLPQEVQEEYISPKAAIRQKSRTLAPISRERQKERGGRPKGKKDSQPRAKRADTDRPRAKKKLSATHKHHISEANLRRWQRYREQKGQSR